MELHPLGAGQGLLRGDRLLGQGADGREQRRRRVVVGRQEHREAVLPRRQEPRRVHPGQGPSQAGQEQGRRRVSLRPAVPSLPAQHRLPAAAPDLRRRPRRRPAVRQLPAGGAPEHGLPRFQLHLWVGLWRGWFGCRGVSAGEEARAACDDGVGRADARRRVGRALLPAAGPVLVLQPHGHPGGRLRRRHHGDCPRLPPQRGRTQERRRAQGARHRHLGHGLSSGDGAPRPAGQDVQGEAVLELVPPQHRPRGDPAGHRQHLPGAVHRAGGQLLHRLLWRLRRRVGDRRRRLRDQEVLPGRRLTEAQAAMHGASRVVLNDWP